MTRLMKCGMSKWRGVVAACKDARARVCVCVLCACTLVTCSNLHYVMVAKSPFYNSSHSQVNVSQLTASRPSSRVNTVSILQLQWHLVEIVSALKQAACHRPCSHRQGLQLSYNTSYGFSLSDPYLSFRSGWSIMVWNTSAWMKPLLFCCFLCQSLFLSNYLSY